MLWFSPTIETDFEAFGHVAATSRGTNIVTGSAVEGSVVSLGTTSFEWNSINLHLSNASAQNAMLLDLMAGTTIVAENLAFHSAIAGEGGQSWHLPLRIGAGKAVQLRAQSTAVRNFDAMVQGSGIGQMGAPGFSQLIALNAFASSRGVVLDGGAAANTLPGTWTELVASCPQRLSGLLVSVDSAADLAKAAAVSYLIEIGQGIATAERVLFRLNTSVPSGTYFPRPNQFGPLYLAVPAGARLAARVQASVATAGDRTLGVSIYGLVA